MSFGERFLHDPRGVPERWGVESWGEEVVVIDFVGGPYLFHGLDRGRAAAIRAAYGELCRPASAPAPAAATETRFFRAANAEFLGAAHTEGRYDLDLAFSPERVDIVGPNFLARLDLAPALRAEVWCPDTPGALGLLAFHNSFRVLVAYRLLALGGLLLHSSGVVRDGEAYLLLGQSGAGKSTFARLSLEAGLRILSDDMNGVLARADGVVAEKLPFAGSLERTQTDASTYPLRFLGLLGKGTGNGIGPRPLSDAEAIATLVASAPFVNTNPWALETLMGVAEALVRRCPLFPIIFGLAGGFWDGVQFPPRAATGAFPHG